MRSRTSRHIARCWSRHVRQARDGRPSCADPPQSTAAHRRHRAPSYFIHSKQCAYQPSAIKRFSRGEETREPSIARRQENAHAPHAARTHLTRPSPAHLHLCSRSLERGIWWRPRHARANEAHLPHRHPTPAPRSHTHAIATSTNRTRAARARPTSPPHLLPPALLYCNLPSSSSSAAHDASNLSSRMSATTAPVAGRTVEYRIGCFFSMTPTLPPVTGMASCGMCPM